MNFFKEEFVGILKSILILNASIILQKIKRSEAFLARWDDVYLPFINRFSHENIIIDLYFAEPSDVYNNVFIQLRKLLSNL